jgi:hypothetical protein
MTPDTVPIQPITSVLKSNLYAEDDIHISDDVLIAILTAGYDPDDLSDDWTTILNAFGFEIE